MVLVGRRKVVGKDICAPFGMGQRAKADCNQFPAIGQGMRLMCGSQVHQDKSGLTFILLGRSSPWVSRRCLLQLGSGPKQQAREEC